jgi:hypothetical protein
MMLRESEIMLNVNKNYNKEYLIERICKIIFANIASIAIHF